MAYGYSESTHMELRQTPAIAFFLLVVALVSLSFTAIFIRISLFDISANATLFNRLWIATIIFGVWNGVGELRRKPTEPVSTPINGTPSRTILLVILVAVLHVTGRFFWTWSLTQTSVVNATLLANTPPIFTVLGGWILLKQRFDNQFIGGMAIALCGALTLGLSDLSTLPSGHSASGAIPALGDAAALLSSVFYAASCLIIERLRASLGAHNILFWRCFIGALVMLPLVLMSPEPILPTTLSGWVAVVCLAAICEALGHGLVVYSLKYLSAAFVNVFLLLESVLTAVFAYLIFSESLGWINLLTSGLILGGVCVAKMSARSPAASTAE